MRVALVTGGRDYRDVDNVRRALDRIDPDVVIHGNSGNTDLAAKAWGILRRRPEHSYPAFWKKLGNYAGPERNGRMAAVVAALREYGDEVWCLAFPGGKGTNDCCEQLRSQGLTVHDGEDVARGGKLK